MSDRIDYLYNAQERVKVALKDPDQGNALVTAQIATAEALIALTQQQRIANLIAMGQFSNGDSRPPLMNLAVEATDEYRIQPVAAIREALGLS